MESQTIKAYKAFNKDLTCRGFQYEVGKEYETDNAKLCEEGFHACENPIDVFNYYPPADSRFCLVELSGKIDKESGDSKIAATKIKICEEISLAELINAAVEFNKAHSAKETTTQGYGAHAITQGYSAHSTTQGDYANAITQGDGAHAITQGYGAHSTTQGDYANAITQGDGAHAITQGDYANAITQGYSAHAITQGDKAHATVKECNSIAAALGVDSQASAPIGGAIVVAEYGKFNGICCPLIGIKSAIVDGITLKPDTFYCLKNGEFQEVPEKVLYDES